MPSDTKLVPMLRLPSIGGSNLDNYEAGEAALYARLGAIRTCALALLNRQPDTKIRFKVKIPIGKDGRVKAVDFDRRSAPADPAWRRCVTAALEGIVLEPPPSSPNARLKLGVEIEVKPSPGSFADDLASLCEVAAQPADQRLQTLAYRWEQRIRSAAGREMLEGAATSPPNELYRFFRLYAADKGVPNWTCPALEAYLR